MALVLPEIFRAYDIRGIFSKTLTTETAYQIGQAVATKALAEGETKIIVARDGRLSSPALKDALTQGIISAGCNVIDIGMAPTPLLYFAAHTLQSTSSGIMITGSHNPRDYNGFKIILNGKALYGDAILELYKIIKKKVFGLGNGHIIQQDMFAAYTAAIQQLIKITKQLHIVVDCGNGVPGIIAPNLYEKLGIKVTRLYCNVDGNFPNHHPDPGDPSNLQELSAAVKRCKANLGIAFDGDGDRLGVVDNNGKIINGDRLLMLFAKDLLSRNNNATIIYDVKCSKHVETVINNNGGTAIMWRTGHSMIKAKMRETNALLAGEMSGHIFFKENWSGADDAIYAGAKLLHILDQYKNDSAALFATLPDSTNTPEISIDVPEDRKFTIMENIIKKANFPEAKIITIDGLRVEFRDSWGLIRCSNTSPKLVMRFEADSSDALTKIQDKFSDLLKEVL